MNPEKLTAYALGELPESELKIFETEVAKSPALQREVAEIRAIAGALTREFEHEPRLVLTPDQRDRVAEGRQSFWARIIPWPWLTSWQMMKLVPAVAAVAAICFGIMVQLKNDGTLDESPFVRQAPSQPVPAKPASRGARALIPEEEKGKALEARQQDEAADMAAEPTAAVKTPPAKLESPRRENQAPPPPVNQAAPAAAGAPAPGTPPVALGGAKAKLSRSSGMYFKEAKKDAYGTVDGRAYAPADAERDDTNMNTEAYSRVEDNEFKLVSREPLSTFSIDVDTASYSNMRRFLNEGQLPPKDSVRIEEMVNYFPYNYEGPRTQDPFAVNVEIREAPWKPEHRLVRIGLKGKEIAPNKRPPSNLVFLIDVSGSMEDANKLPWVKASLKMLADQLGDRDKVAITVYAGSAGLVLPPTHDKNKILEALDRLNAGGSTNGAQGIEQAYQVAQQNFIPGGTNRVILATDGDFNVGTTSEGDLTRLIEQKAKTGIFLSVLGFGMGNLKDATMVKLADKGHGHYAYIDSLNEARKVLVEEMGSTLVTIAKDVKIQVEFNPAEVAGFRLVGYEKRIMAHEDFNDDTKDAGVIGAGHTITALYEIVPAGKAVPTGGVDALKYQSPTAPAPKSGSGELMTLKLRYKKPEDGTSKLITFPLKDDGGKFAAASKDFKFQSAVASFGMLLRDSKHKGQASFDQVIENATSGRGEDKLGYRTEFVELVKKAKALSGARKADVPTTR